MSKLFLKIDQYRYLAAGVYLSEAPDDPTPPPPPTLYELLNDTIPLYLFCIHTGGGGGWGVGEPVRRLEGR
jgi:hypothetical protein